MTASPKTNAATAERLSLMPGNRDAAMKKVKVLHKEMDVLVPQGKLVCAEQLLDQLFDPGAKPSIRWLRARTRAKTIPYFRIGHLVFFDVEMVRAALAGKNLVQHRIKAPSVSPSV